MRFYHRHSFFPLIVIALSLALAGLIYWSVQHESSAGPGITVQEVEPVDPEEYRAALKDIVKTFTERLASSFDDLDKLLATQTALAGILELRVPVEFKDLHLSLAVAFSDIEKSLQREDRNIDAALTRIDELTQTYSWLAP